jgi:hypothetical protein
MFISSANASSGYLPGYQQQRPRDSSPPVPGSAASKNSTLGNNAPSLHEAITQVAGSDTRLQTAFHEGSSQGSDGSAFKDGKSPNGQPQTSAPHAELAKKVQQTLIAFTIGVGSVDGKKSGNALDSFLKSLPLDVRQRWQSFVNGQIVSDPATTEQAANQVANLALSEYPGSGATASTQQERDARQQFADQVTPIIGQGFHAASASVGSQPDSTQQTLKQIHALVLDHVNSFVGVDRKV